MVNTYMILLCFALVLSVVHPQSQSTVAILVLGCHISDIQRDRVYSAIKYAETKLANDNVIWFLSGGVKHSIDNIVSEANDMQLLLAHAKEEKKNWSYEIDTKAKNTSENFAYFRKYISSRKQDISQTFIVTSEFHHKRASKIIEGVFGSHEVDWILGKKSCNTCWSDEIVHSRNIQSDIDNALRKLIEVSY